MHAEPLDLDQLIRADLDATRPDRVFDLSKIETRAAQLRWRGRTQLAVLSVAAVITVVVALAATATTGTKSVNVADDHPGIDTPVTSAHATTTTRATTTTIGSTQPNNRPNQPSSAIVPPPGDGTPDTIASPVTPTTVGDSVTPTTVDNRVTPTTTKSPTPTTTTPTTVVDPNWPPMEPGNRRIILVLDDDGLHAPATFKVDGNAVDFLLLDKRSDRGRGGFAYTTDGAYSLAIQAWDEDLYGTQPAQYNLVPGDVLHFQAIDDGFNQIPGAAVNITIIPD